MTLTNPSIKARNKIVKVDGKPLKKLVEKFGWGFPSENVAVVGPLGNTGWIVGLPASTYHVYVFAEPEDRAAYAKMIRDGGEMLLFRLPVGAGFGRGQGPIHEIWTRDRGRAAKGMIAVARVFARDPDYAAGEVYVDMMSVRPAFRRNRVNAAFMKTLLDAFDGKALLFSKATQDGKAFIEWLREEGAPVA